MPSAIITDNRMSAESRFPNDQIISTIHDVLMLEIGTAVMIYQLASGRVLDGPCHVARTLIERGDLIEVCDG